MIKIAEEIKGGDLDAQNVEKLDTAQQDFL